MGQALIFRISPPSPFCRHVKSDPNVVASGDSMKTRTHPCLNTESNTVITGITFATVTKKDVLVRTVVIGTVQVHK